MKGECIKKRGKNSIIALQWMNNSLALTHLYAESVQLEKTIWGEQVKTKGENKRPMRVSMLKEPKVS